jgi:hypothetical protein
MNAAVDVGRSATPWLMRVVSLFAILGLCGASLAGVSDHLFWGQVLQSRVYDDPAYATPIQVFQLKLETDETVASIEFSTPAGYWGLIPNEASTFSDEVETYHWTYDATHVWEYWGYFAHPDALGDFFGDGEYIIIVRYADGTEEETAVWYAVPGEDLAIAPPTQKPNITRPSYDGVTASPVAFEWDPVVDANVWDVFVSIWDPKEGYLVSDIYDANAIASDPHSLSEGRYYAELSFENYYDVVNGDGVPFDLIKSTTLWHPFEVIYGTVYRFRAPATDHDFYTMDDLEMDKLIEEYSDVWKFEGPAFHAWATKYFPDLAPVHRFWSERSGSHLYTIDEAEKDALLAHSSWTYEGVAFYAYPEGRQPDDSLPVYRFWNPSSNSHLYTIDPHEAQGLLTQHQDMFIFEGTAFYVYE